MKICVFSDSHGFPAPMIRAIRREAPDFVFFLGDGERDLKTVRQQFPGLPMEAVRGNCDLRSDLPAELVCTVAGIRFLVTHGHRWEVKTDRMLDALKNAAREAGAQAVLFGHTHVPRLEEEDGLLLLNPGSVGFGTPAYAALEIADGRIRPELKTL